MVKKKNTADDVRGLSASKKKISLYTDEFLSYLLDYDQLFFCEKNPRTRKKSIRHYDRLIFHEENMWHWLWSKLPEGAEDIPEGTYLDGENIAEVDITEVLMEKVAKAMERYASAFYGNGEWETIFAVNQENEPMVWCYRK